MPAQTDPPADPPAPAGSVFAPPHRALTLGVILSVGMVAFESLGVATVLPGIARSLDGLGAYGWGLSALMLANIVATVLAGRAADRLGPARPLALGMLLFAAGCALAGTAGSWPLFLLGRVGQGLGVGVIMAMAYTVVGLAYPERLRARMFALLSSAWTIPSLVGPVVAGSLADRVGWRAVFLLMLPLVAVAAALTLSAVRRVRAAEAEAGEAAGTDRTTPARTVEIPWWKGLLASSILLTAGTGLLLQALLLRDLVLLAVLSVAGIALAVPALRRVTPGGTLTARPGLGAGVALRGLLCGVYFGSEAFLPLGLQELRGLSPTAAGLGLSAGAITWVLGSLFQARRDAGPLARPGSRTAGVTLGFALLLGGVAVTATAVLADSVPAWIAVLGWAIGGAGMGVAFNASTTETMEQTPPGRQGEISGALQLAQTLATALVAGLGGAALALAGHHGATTRAALLWTFAFTAALAVAGLLLARRLTPRRPDAASAAPAPAAAPPR
ncbi:MFS transporter [Streptomyces paludis]|uniref:MFS transporter n=1 Tax=Streptomyces paludis TaxID=2282738 RepID=A0A345HUA0_9ACTN|nr:MFS transporter [Streptomyces paludis]AXG80274.1 MFS transporter [Streptomyces paludis]